MRRLTTKRIRLIAGGAHEPIQCFCGSVGWRHGFQRFPMQHVSTCLTCSREVRVDIRPAPPRSAPKPPQDPDPPIGFPPFWY